MLDYIFWVNIVPFATLRTPIRVLFADTDAMGIVYYGNYFRFFEAGRRAYVAHFSPEIAGTYETNTPMLFPVTATSCRYRKSARVYEQLTVETRLIRVKRASFVFAYLLRRDRDQAVISEAESEHAFVNEAGKVLRFDHRLKTFFERAHADQPAVLPVQVG